MWDKTCTKGYRSVYARGDRKCKSRIKTNGGYTALILNEQEKGHSKQELDVAALWSSETDGMNFDSLKRAQTLPSCNEEIPPK